MARARLYQRAKNVVHGIQLLVILIGVTLTIVILTKGPKDSRLTYYFVLCLLSFPFLIYQTIFPVVKLTRRLANAYVHLAFDLILVVLWLSGFVAEIVWIKDGSKAAEDWKKGDKVCEKFGWGPTSRCKLGQGTVIIGIVIWYCCPEILYPLRDLKRVQADSSNPVSSSRSQPSSPFMASHFTSATAAFRARTLPNRSKQEYRRLIGAIKKMSRRSLLVTPRRKAQK